MHIGIIGMILFLSGEFLPLLNNHWTGVIVANIHQSVDLQDSGLLLVTSFIYIAAYFVVFFFIYFGSMLMAWAFSGQMGPLMFILLVLLGLSLFNQWHHDHFSYHSHFLALGMITFLQLYIPKQKYFYLILSIIIFLVLVSILWLQLIPALTVFGFGTDDLAASIKIVDNYFTDSSLFNTLATIFFAVFLIIAIIFTLLIHLVDKQKSTLKNYHLQEEELEETRTALVESKVYEEINMLVHDLKTPLVTLEGLLSLLHMKMHAQNITTMEAHFERMNQSAEKMKDMISEILHEDNKQPIPVNELLEYVTSHLGLNEQNVDLHINLEPDLPTIYVNKVRFSRAISNILENAVKSFAGKAGYIDIDVKRIDESILICIEDNGTGIKMTHLDDIWRTGFSTRQSSGIGLSFVKKVVENHQGTITVDSVKGSHTQMTISLPIHKEGETHVDDIADRR
ncbi:sensor histidine kinase [Lentibacillus salinarum]|uniref:histidine kinase n=2 Tax=Lentibacillus salinarum TaxID=446820 RepID=A0ABW3ZSG9_9BACI